MQINGSQYSTAFGLKSNDVLNDQTKRSDDLTKTPVTIDSQAVFEVEQQNPSLPAILPSTQQQQITTNDSQQAKFVRFLATQSEPSTSSSTTNLPATLPPALPKGVQEYLQNAQITTVSPRLFDEIV